MSSGNRGFKLGQALSAVADEDAPDSPRTEDQLAARIGRNFVDRILERASEGALGAAAPPDPTQQVEGLKGIVQAAGDLKKLFADGDGDDETERFLDKLPKRMRRRFLRMLDGDDDEEPRGRRGGGDDSLTLKMLDKFDSMMERLDKGQRDAIRELKSEMKGKGGAESSWEEEARKALLGRLNSNPLAEYMQMREHFREELGREHTDVDTYLLRRREDREDRKLDAELEQARDQGQYRRDIMDVAQSLIEDRKKGAPPAARAPRSDRLRRPPLNEIQCGHCGYEFLVKDDPRRVAGGSPFCPSCGERAGLEAEPDLAAADAE